jgi:hypothetical protein
MRRYLFSRLHDGQVMQTLYDFIVRIALNFLEITA